MSTHLKKTLKTKYDRKTILLSRAKTFLKKLQAKKKTVFILLKMKVFTYFLCLSILSASNNKKEERIKMDLTLKDLVHLY